MCSILSRSVVCFDSLAFVVDVGVCVDAAVDVHVGADADV